MARSMRISFFSRISFYLFNVWVRRGKGVLKRAVNSGEQRRETVEETRGML